MTVIVGHKDGWMVADTREMIQDEVLPTVAKKIQKIGTHSIVGAAGDAGFHTFAIEALQDASEDVNRAIPVISEWLRKESGESDYYVVLVNHKRELWLIDSHGAASQVTEDFTAIGSGGLPTEMYLKGLSVNRPNHRITAQDAAMAIGEVADRLTSIGHNTYTLELTSE